jgi:hypothetical protein
MAIIVVSGNPIFIAPPSPGGSANAAQISRFDVYYTRNPLHECGPGVCMTWFPFSGATISKYGVYRSIVGFKSPTPALSAISGLTLRLSVNLGTAQEITFNGLDPVVDQMNGFFRGVKVTKSCNETADEFILRVSDTTSPGVIRVLGGTALALLQQTQRTITSGSEFTRLVFVPSDIEDDAEGVEYCDCDGRLSDVYRLTTVNGVNQESLPTESMSPTETTGKLCQIYGIVSTPEGVRVSGAIVSARIVRYPQSVTDPSFIDESTVEVVSDGSGAFEFMALQCSLVEVTCEPIYLHRKIEVPQAARVALSTLLVSRAYQNPENL